jgi:hypothetical protein
MSSINFSFTSLPSQGFEFQTYIHPYHHPFYNSSYPFIQLNILKEKLQNEGIHFSWSSTVTEYLAKKGDELSLGNTELKEIFKNEVENLIASMRLEKKNISKIELIMKDGKISFV